MEDQLVTRDTNGGNPNSEGGRVGSFADDPQIGASASASAPALTSSDSGRCNDGNCWINGLGVVGERAVNQPEQSPRNGACA